MKYTTITLGLLCMLTSLLRSEQAQEPFNREYGYELVRYLYRWHMDDAILAQAEQAQAELDLYYRYLQPTLDAGDRSEHLEIILPQVQMVVVLKRSEYRVEKMDLHLQDPYFKVQSAQHYRTLHWDAAKYQKISYDYEAMLGYLFRTRNDQAFPDDATVDRLRVEALRAFEAEGHLLSPQVAADHLQIAYVAPISIVSNDLWFYWVNGRKFICFTADLHHSHERFWEFSTLDVEIIDADEDVVVSDVINDSQGFFTKDYVGRILFNCLIHGKQVRHELDAPSAR
jgi:hypothetical protein